MDNAINYASMIGKRFQTNVQAGFKDMSPEQWLRLVIIVGACTFSPAPLLPPPRFPLKTPPINTSSSTDLLLRPYIIKLGAKSQMAQHEREAAETEEEAKKAAMSPNQLRGAVDIPDDTDDEDDEKATAAGTSTAADWGKKARRRQRAVIKKLLDEEERRLRESREEEEDKDIEEFLVKE